MKMVVGVRIGRSVVIGRAKERDRRVSVVVIVVRVVRGVVTMVSEVVFGMIVARVVRVVEIVVFGMNFEGIGGARACVPSIRPRTRCVRAV